MARAPITNRGPLPNWQHWSETARLGGAVVSRGLVWYAGFPLEGVPASLRQKIMRDAEIWHAWRPLYAETWIARRHRTPRNCYLDVRRTQAWLINSLISCSSYNALPTTTLIFGTVTSIWHSFPWCTGRQRKILIDWLIDWYDQATQALATTLRAIWLSHWFALQQYTGRPIGVAYSRERRL